MSTFPFCSFSYPKEHQHLHDQMLQPQYDIYTIHYVNGSFNVQKNNEAYISLEIWNWEIQRKAYSCIVSELLNRAVRDSFVGRELEEFRERAEKAERTIEHVRDIFRDILEIDT